MNLLPIQSSDGQWGATWDLLARIHRFVHEFQRDSRDSENERRAASYFMIDSLLSRTMLLAKLFTLSLDCFA